MRWHDIVGYGVNAESSPGVYVDTITERQYYGDVLRVSRKLREEDHANDDIIAQHFISVVSDPFAIDNFTNIRYAKWLGEHWKVIDVEVKYPRLILRLGGVYNGIAPED